jgi:hypothetical protein
VAQAKEAVAPATRLEDNHYINPIHFGQLKTIKN